MRILPQADQVTLIAARVQGFEVHPCLWLPYYLLDVAAPVRRRGRRMGSVADLERTGDGRSANIGSNSSD